jgi:hypothetical protein
MILWKRNKNIQWSAQQQSRGLRQQQIILQGLQHFQKAKVLLKRPDEKNLELQKEFLEATKYPDDLTLDQMKVYISKNKKKGNE